jgi:hypothetical protein
MDVSRDVWIDASPQQEERYRAFGERMARLAWSYSCSILIGCASRPTQDAKNATGVSLEVSGRNYLLTALHVVDWYREKIKGGSHTHFQVGDLSLCPDCRMVYEDAVNDLAVLWLRPGEVRLVGQTPFIARDDWPPLSPKVGNTVQFCGYARINRVDGAAGQIDSTVLPLIATVANSSEHHFSVRIPREDYRWDGRCLLRPDQAFLGGMSGGPALVLDDPRYPLAGIVSQGHDQYDIVRFSCLSGVPWRELGKRQAGISHQSLR